MSVAIVSAVAIRPAETAEDIEAVRVIHNAGREWMTRDTSEISPDRQRRWWASFVPERYRLYVAESEGVVIGYGFLWRPEYGAWWVSLVVASDHRGRGVGAELYRYLAEQIEGIAWAEIRRDNTASIRAAEKAGYYRVGSNERGLLYARYPR